MNEYIKREGAVEAAWQILNGLGYSEKHNDRLVEEVDAVFGEVVAEDVRPVRRGKWKHGVCQICFFDWPGVAPLASVPNFCPKCGAMMEKS